MTEIVARAQAAGTPRPDVETTDIPLLQFMALSDDQFDRAMQTARVP